MIKHAKLKGSLPHRYNTDLSRIEYWSEFRDSWVSCYPCNRQKQFISKPFYERYEQTWAEPIDSF